MSIATAITAAQGRVANAYTAISNKGGTLPATRNLANMPTAISSIPSGGTIDSLTVTPTTSQQTITASGGTDGYSPITVNAVTSAIDNNITAGNIKDGVTILGVTGTYGKKIGITIDGLIGNVSSGTLSKPNVHLNIDLSGITTINTGALEYTFRGLYVDSVDFSSIVTVNSNGFSHAFQNSILPANYGVDFSSLEEIKTSGCSNMFDSNSRVKSVDLSSLTTVSGSSTCYYMFYSCTALTTIDLSSLTTVSGSNACEYMFYSCSALTTVSLNSLTTVSGSAACRYMFNSCSVLTTIDLSSLVTVGGNGCAYMFNNCTALTTVSLNSLKTVSGSNGCSSMFSNCYNLSSNFSLPNLEEISGTSGCASMLQSASGRAGNITSFTFPKLKTLTGATAMQYFFRYRTALQSVSFPALTSTSFGSNTNQFSNMLGGITGCTVHFPSNLQSVIGSWSSVTGGFGGTNTTVLFDLTATE